MAVDLLDRVVGKFRMRVLATERADGDVHPERVPPQLLRSRQQAITGASWAMVDQVHGCLIHVAEIDDGWPISGIADVVVAAPGAGPIAVWAADCAPVVVVGQSGLIVAAHAGWRGLAAGVIDVACNVIADAGDHVIAAVVGPLIHPCCYEFSAADIALVAAGVHAEVDSVSAATSSGALALDVPASVRFGLATHGVVADLIGDCTGCSDRWFSHRVRSEPGRHAVVAWAEPHGRVTA